MKIKSDFKLFFSEYDKSKKPRNKLTDESGKTTPLVCGNKIPTNPTTYRIIRIVIINVGWEETFMIFKNNDFNN